MAHPNDELLVRLYTALDRKDGDAMAACYAPDARFEDPAFGELRGDEPGAMWRMLTSRAADLRCELLEHAADDTTGSAKWKATYTFTQTGRPVVNVVDSTFRFAGGLIAEQDDRFSYFTWSRQALGLPGLLLGWTPILPAATRKKARQGLDEFMAAPPPASPGPSTPA
jgi:ketosteroid isomerase-like protein